MVFLGAAACSKRKTHIAIDAITAVLPPRAQALCALVVEMVVLALMGAITYYGYTLCTMATQATSTLKIPQYAVYAVVPFSAAPDIPPYPRGGSGTASGAWRPGGSRP